MDKNNSSNRNPFWDMSPFNAQGDVNVIIDTPQKSRNKFKYDPALGIFMLGHVLPMGAVFPFNFGYIPSTLGADGDPLDVLVLMDDAAFAGCLVVSRLIGVIEAEQTEKGKTIRNDRLIGVAAESRDQSDVTSIHQLSDSMLDEIEHFFISYNQAKGREFKPLGRYAADRAHKLVEKGIRDKGRAQNVKHET